MFCKEMMKEKTKIQQWSKKKIFLWLKRQNTTFTGLKLAKMHVMREVWWKKRIIEMIYELLKNICSKDG